jgi:2-C-methyl-D-erythritol 4-phosphate cytidylyltransferase
MLSTEHFWCVVPAAGVGKRMGAPVPKQYLPLLGARVADHTLATLLRVNLFSRIVVALSAEDEWWPESSDMTSPRVLRCEGGAERFHSVLKGLDALAGLAHDEDWVLVHDIARPCVRLSDIERLVSAVRWHPVGGLLASPVRDTMKRADASGAVAETVDRQGLWHALTPQMFRYGLLRNAIREGMDRGLAMTDEASAMEAQGYAPLLIEGAADNIKITHPQDLALAALFLQQRQAQAQQ